MMPKTLPASLPTKHGPFQVIAYQDSDMKEHLVLLKGKVEGEENVIVRVHSQCLTGDTFTSLRCDCGEQLDKALKKIAKEGGIILYLQQEGRGIGLFNKIAAYHHQDQGMDTVEANQKLGFDADVRDYAVAADILRDLGVKSIKLITNNPRKIEGLQKAGIHITQRVPLVIKPNEINHTYLKTKQQKLGHALFF